MGRPILKKLAKEVGARPPLLVPLGDWGCFLGEDTTLRGEFSFPKGRKKQFVLKYSCYTNPHAVTHILNQQNTS